MGHGACPSQEQKAERWGDGVGGGTGYTIFYPTKPVGEDRVGVVAADNCREVAFVIEIN